MDPRAFDRLTRLFSLARSRRAVVRSLVASGLLGLAGAEAAAKAKRGKKKPGCNKKSRPHRCGKGCTNKKTDSDNCGSCGNTCFPGETCSDGVCACGAGMVVCGGVCAEGNCCEGDQVKTCGENESCCAPFGCKNLADDAGNCGGCGVVCEDTSNTCVEGSCSCGKVQGVCTDGRICSQDEMCVCPFLPTVPLGCGPCQIECPEDQPCSDGRCGCKADEAFYAGSCHECQPPPGVGIPGNDDIIICNAGEEEHCSCGRRCCDDPDDCFQVRNGGQGVVDEFCCKGSGLFVCGDLCCESADCDKGCIRETARGGSYRRPGR